MFEKTGKPVRKGNKLIFEFQSDEEMKAFQEVVGIGFFMYSLRNKPEFKNILDSVDQVMMKTGWKKFPA